METQMYTAEGREKRQRQEVDTKTRNKVILPTK